jgi:hypothetical protein
LRDDSPTTTPPDPTDLPDLRPATDLPLHLLRQIHPGRNHLLRAHRPPQTRPERPPAISDDEYIWIRNWDRFQHYHDRNPPWIKNYVELLHSAEYRGLSAATRGVLHGLWLEYAAARGGEPEAPPGDGGETVGVPRRDGGETVGVPRGLPRDTAELTRRLGVRVTERTLTSLNHAGFIEFSASNLLALRALAAARPRARAKRSREEVSKETSQERARASERSPARTRAQEEETRPAPAARPEPDGLGSEPDRDPDALRKIKALTANIGLAMPGTNPPPDINIVKDEDDW